MSVGVELRGVLWAFMIRAAKLSNGRPRSNAIPSRISTDPATHTFRAVRLTASTQVSWVAPGRFG